MDDPSIVGPRVHVSLLTTNGLGAPEKLRAGTPHDVSAYAVTIMDMFGCIEGAMGAQSSEPQQNLEDRLPGTKAPNAHTLVGTLIG